MKDSWQKSWNGGVMEYWSDDFQNPVLRHSTRALHSLIVFRQNIFRPELHLAVQAIHGRITDLELEMLHAVFDEFIAPPAHIVYRAEDVTVESKLHAVDVALVALAAGFQRRHRQVQTFFARLGDGRELFDTDGDLRGIAAFFARRLRQHIAADFHFFGRKPAGDPAFAVFTRPLGGELHPAADPNRRMGFLKGLGIALSVFEFDEIAFI